jgi:hypothetical protein
VVRPERLELPTLCSEGRCSIQLSYGRIKNTFYGKPSRKTEFAAAVGQDLSVLQTLASKLGLAVENALQRSRGDTVSASGVAASAAHAGGD